MSKKLSLAEQTNTRGVAGGYASLDSNGKIPTSQMNLSLSNLTDVNVLSKSDGNTLVWSASTQKWISGTSTSGTASASTRSPLNLTDGVILAPADDYGYPRYLSMAGNVVTCDNIQVAINSITYNIPQQTISIPSPLDLVYLHVKPDLTLNYSIVAPQSVGTFLGSGIYLSFEDGLSDLYGGIWLTSGELNTTSARSKFGTRSYEVRSNENLVYSLAAPTIGESKDSRFIFHPYPAWQMDFWLFQTQFVSASRDIFTATSNAGFGIRINQLANTGTLRVFLSSNNTANDITAGTMSLTISLNTWTYVGLQFTGSQYILWVNSSSSSVTSSAAVACALTNVGFYNAGSASYFIDEVITTPYLRPTNSSSVFTPSHSLSFEPFASLINSCSLTDVYTMRWLSISSLTTNATYPRSFQFGTLANSTIYTPWGPALSVMPQWTVEMNFFVLATSTYPFCLLEGRYYNSGAGDGDYFDGLLIWVGASGSVQIYFTTVEDAGQDRNSASITFSNGRWNHLAITYDYLVGYNMFLNGTSFYNSNILAPIAMRNLYMINRQRGGSWQGYMSDFRITPQCLYTSNFTAPLSSPATNEPPAMLLNSYGDVGSTRYGLGAGTVNALYIGTARISTDICHHWCDKQPEYIAYSAGNSKVMRNGEVVGPSTSYDLTSNKSSMSHIAVFFGRQDGQLVGYNETSWGSYFLASENPTYSTSSTPMYPITDFQFNSNYALMTDTEGNVWGVGEGVNGALGGNAPLHTPRIIFSGVSPKPQLTGQLGYNMAEVQHTAIFDQNKIWVSGANTEGQLGLGDRVTRYAFTRVAGTWDGVRIGTLVMYAWNSTGLYACGRDGWGYLGIGGGAISSGVPTLTLCRSTKPLTNIKDVYAYTSAINSASFTSGTSSEYSTVVLLNNGEVFITGNISGGGTTNKFTNGFIGPVCKNVKSVSHGGFTTVCILNDNSAVVLGRGFGYYVSPSLFTRNIGQPFLYMFEKVYAVSSVISPHRGDTGLVISADGNAYCTNLIAGTRFPGVSSSTSLSNPVNAGIVELSLPTGIVDAYLGLAANIPSSVFVYGTFYKLANGQIYGCGIGASMFNSSNTRSSKNVRVL
jgi:hypothetical protein